MTEYSVGDRVVIAKNEAESEFHGELVARIDRDTNHGWLVELDDPIVVHYQGDEMVLRQLPVREEQVEPETKWVGLVGTNNGRPISHLINAMHRLGIPYRAEDNVRGFEHMIFVPQEYYPEGTRTLENCKND